MKSESVSLPVHKWRLSRTLRRTIDYRPIENDDVKYAWAAYKQGGLSEMGFEKDLSPEQFKEAFERAVVSNCHAAWTLFGHTRKGSIPVGIVLAAWAPLASYLIIVSITWMPWATKRNIVEGTIGFFNEARKEHYFVGYALPDHKRMYEVAARHGIMRRAGTSYAAIPGHRAAIFETIDPKYGVPS